MKPFVVHYTYRERELSARVLGDDAREVEARFRNAHPNVGDIRRIEPARGFTSSSSAPQAPRRPLEIRRPTSDAERERLVAQAHQLTAELRQRLSA